MSFDALIVMDDVAAYLETSGIGTVGKTLFKSLLPAQPLEATAVILTGGPKERGNPIDYPALQILTRAREARPALAMAQRIYPLLNHRVPAFAHIKARVVPEHLPGPYYRDANGNAVATLNFGLYVTP